MPGSQTAVRETDQIEHSAGLFGAIEGILLGVAVGALAGAAIVATGGLAVVAVGAIFLGGGLGGMFGKTFGQHSTHGAGVVASGSPNVWIGHDIKRAARAHADVAHCEEHSDAEPSQSPPAHWANVLLRAAARSILTTITRHGRGTKAPVTSRLDRAVPPSSSAARPLPWTRLTPKCLSSWMISSPA